MALWSLLTEGDGKGGKSGRYRVQYEWFLVWPTAADWTTKYRRRWNEGPSFIQATIVCVFTTRQVWHLRNWTIVFSRQWSCLSARIDVGLQESPSRKKWSAIQLCKCESATLARAVVSSQWNPVSGNKGTRSGQWFSRRFVLASCEWCLAVKYCNDFTRWWKRVSILDLFAIYSGDLLKHFFLFTL